MAKQTILYRKNYEYDKPLKNNFVIRKTHKGNHMDKENYRCPKMEQNGMTVIFVLPEQSREEGSHSMTASTKKEIRDILSHVLKEYLTTQSRQ